MRLANINGRLALRAGDGFIDVASASSGRFGPDPQSVYASWPEFSAWAQDEAQVQDGLEITEPGSDAVWGPPVPSPRQIFAIGLNYRDHARESGIDVPEEPPSSPSSRPR